VKGKGGGKEKTWKQVLKKLYPSSHRPLPQRSIERENVEIVSVVKLEIYK
jgi:hypothetical protein